ncbi:MAG: hypothetical protein K6G62_05350 [Eubacterium sp.]|nr:hypothetical protein [Eubacterium sp.]
MKSIAKTLSGLFVGLMSLTLLLAPEAKAETTLEVCTPDVHVSTASELSQALTTSSSKSTIILDKDITDATSLTPTISGSIILDLNGHNLTITGDCGFHMTTDTDLFIANSNDCQTDSTSTSSITYKSSGGGSYNQAFVYFDNQDASFTSVGQNLGSNYKSRSIQIYIEGQDACGFSVKNSGNICQARGVNLLGTTVYSSSASHIFYLPSETSSQLPIILGNQSNIQSKEAPFYCNNYYSSKLKLYDCTLGTATANGKIFDICDSGYTSDLTSITVSQFLGSNTTAYKNTTYTASNQYDESTAISAVISKMCTNVSASTTETVQLPLFAYEGGHVYLTNFYQLIFTSHSYSDTTNEATCGCDGCHTHTCTECGYSTETIIPATGNHTWDKGTVTVEPTETSEGVMTYVCTTCGATKTETIPALNADSSTSSSSSSTSQASTTTTTSLAKQTITITKVKTYKVKSLKKKKLKIKLKAKTSGDGKLTYSVKKTAKKLRKYIKVSKKGVITIKKKAKKGTYKVLIKASATSKYAAAKKLIKIKIK